MSAVARRFGITEGQLYTTGIGFLVAVTLLVVGLPPVLSAEPAPRRAEQASSPAPTSAPASDRGREVAAPTPRGGPDRVPLPSSVGSALRAGPATGAGPIVVPSGPAPRSAPEPGSPDVPPPSSETGRRVASGGWAVARETSPLGWSEVPAGAFPVAARAGRIDKASFLRLSGDGPELALGLVEDPGANQLVPLAGVRACAIVERGWELGEAASPRDVPDHDDGRCTPGTQDADGRWVFDLSPLGDLDNDLGLALLPVFEGPATFQVVFAPG